MDRRVEGNSPWGHLSGAFSAGIRRGLWPRAERAPPCPHPRCWPKDRRRSCEHWPRLPAGLKLPCWTSIRLPRAPDPDERARPATGRGFAGCETFGKGAGAALSFLPFANVTAFPFACLPPSRASDASMVTTSPILTESCVQPSLSSSIRLGNSTAQVASATSTKMKTWGFVQSNLITVPFSVNGFLSS